MSYRRPTTADDLPATYAAKLLKLPEFEHLRDGEAYIEWLFRLEPERRGGRDVLGTVHMPQVQGQLKDVFLWMLTELFGRLPDFLVVLDLEYWEACDARLREILVYHELCHAIQKVDREGSPRFDEEGRPVWGLRGHDVEEFSAVVRRYGAWNPDIKEFLAAVSEHDGARGGAAWPFKRGR